MPQAHKVVKSMMIDYGGGKHDYRELSPLCRLAIDQYIGVEKGESPLAYSYSTFMVPTHDILSRIHLNVEPDIDFNEWLIANDFGIAAGHREKVWPVMFADGGDFLDGIQRLRSYVSSGLAYIPVVAVL